MTARWFALLSAIGDEDDDGDDDMAQEAEEDARLQEDYLCAKMHLVSLQRHSGWLNPRKCKRHCASSAPV